MYKESDYKLIKLRHKRCLLFFFLCLFLIVALITLSLCFTSYLAYRYYEIFGGIGIAVLVFFAIFLFYKSADYKRLLLHYESVMAEKKEYIDAKVVKIGDTAITMDDDIRVKEVVLRDKSGEATYYLLAMLDDGTIEADKSYHFLLADRFIRGREYEL